MNQSTNGWVVIDKPLGMTSREAVDRAARCFPPGTALGHSGTLDPLATGVLVLAVGKATRLVEYVQEMGKTYEAEFTLGATSATDDSEGPIQPTANASDPGRAAIESALKRFVGEIEQTPPAFSAAKIAGRRAYKLARAGRTATPQPKMVRIDRIDLREFNFLRLSVKIECGKGTYVRSIARDLGAMLGIGGYVSQLRRTAIGSFTIAEATALDADAATLLPLGRGVENLPRYEISNVDARRLRLGQTISHATTAKVGSHAATFDVSGNLVAVVAASADRRWQPLKAFGS